MVAQVTGFLPPAWETRIEILTGALAGIWGVT